MSKDKITNIDDTNDFGFTFVSEDEVSNLNEVDDLKKRITQLKKMFMPLLINLSKSPDKDMIKWPNRKELLDKQIKLLEELTNI
jgi:hypothetical protein